MKTKTFNHTVKSFTLLLAFALGSSASLADTHDAMDATHAQTGSVVESNDTSWMSPEAAEFARLDTTGNGLLLPYEASQGKAFNKKTFAQADVNRDGYIDQNEYIFFKTGKWPESAQQINEETDMNDTQATTTE